jgi:hypothetical protein
VPAVRFAALTATVAVPVPEPEAGLTVSQEAFSLALQLSVPPPVFAMLIVWAAGVAPPTLPVKAKLVGLSPMVGFVVDVIRVSVMGTCLVMPPPVIVAVPL